MKIKLGKWYPFQFSERKSCSLCVEGARDQERERERVNWLVGKGYVGTYRFDPEGTGSHWKVLCKGMTYWIVFI